jgi:endonuclease YncB( thermonuclease family)
MGYGADRIRANPSTMRLPFVILVLILTTSPACAHTIAGRASVIDGDTFDIHGERIRILDIDAPEFRQLCTMPDSSEWRSGQNAALVNESAYPFGQP